MDTISKILFWVANSLLIPDVIVLLVLFGRSLLLVGSFYNQLITKFKNDKTFEDVIKKLISQDVKLDAVIVDPPRKGCEESFLRDLAAMNIEKIVYVSCNPATLARDMEIMRGLGYKLGAVQPVDMFPGTYHVEAITLLERVK